MTSLLAAGCATGTGGGAGKVPDQDAFATTAGVGTPLTIMGFGLDDEIAQVRYDRAEKAVHGTEIKLMIITAVQVRVSRRYVYYQGEQR